MEFVRGDTQALKFLITFKDKTPVKFEDIDTLFITCKKTIYSNENIFQKTLEDVEIDEEGYVHVTLKPADTECLNYGEYVCDAEITLKSGFRKSKLFKFTLTGETTFHGGDAI